MLNLFTGLTLISVIIVLIVAAVSDVKKRTIPNILSLIIIGLYILYALSLLIQGNASFSSILDSLMVFGITLALGLGLFALRIMGGGDIKLFTALSLFAGKQYILSILLLTALSGGLVALVIFTLSRIRQKKLTENGVDENKPYSVPYGVAISFSGTWLCIHLLGTTSIF